MLMTLSALNLQQAQWQALKQLLQVVAVEPTWSATGQLVVVANLREQQWGWASQRAGEGVEEANHVEHAMELIAKH
jgi:hypothetical protein